MKELKWTSIVIRWKAVDSGAENILLCNPFSISRFVNAMQLLGKESSDLDIALDTMTGYEFGVEVKNYLERHGRHKQSIHKIQSNPDKSKHLETATMRIFDTDVDFSNLRTEIYHDHSRIPVVEFGTPLEDAERRDITINTLFYNLHTQEVEDFTGKGLPDLRNGQIRTPLPPLKTFIDDPLRVLRVIRFASRFSYAIVPEILDAVQHEDIKSAFAVKISRERVGVEVDKMLKGPDPLRSMQLIAKFGFYDLVFVPPPEVTVDEVHENSRQKFGHEPAAVAIHHVHVSHSLLLDRQYASLLPTCVKPLSPASRRFLFLAAALTPFRGMTYIDHKGKTISVVKQIVLSALKLSVHDAECTAAILDHVDHVRDTLKRLASSSSTLPHPKCPGFTLDPNTDSSTPATGSLRKLLGFLVRALGSRPLNAEWYLAVLMTFVLDAAKHFPCADVGDGSEMAGPTAASSESMFHGRDGTDLVLDHMWAHYGDLMSKIQQHGVERAFEFRPLLDGREVAKTLGIRPGPGIGIILEHVMEWQIERGPLANKDECREWLVAEFKNEEKLKHIMELAAEKKAQAA
ncbi:hypothetical protein HK102_000019 [Quaeritorhiza haematococci]|nr:hypothetical protein HK102_000019 [Quaeritorhiza haematococci]